MQKHRLFAGMVMTIALLTATGCFRNWGECLEFNGGKLYYTSGVTEEEAVRLGEYLVEYNYLDGNAKTLQITKTGSTYEVRMAMREGLDQDEEYIGLAVIFGRELSDNVFNGSPVNVHFCDDQLQTLLVIASLDFNGSHVPYTSTVTEDEAMRLGEYLVESGFFDETEKTVLLTKTGTAYKFQMVVREGFDETDEPSRIAAVFIGELSENVFDGGQVEIHFCDAMLRTLYVIASLEVNGGDLIYTSRVTGEEAVRLGEYLVESGFFDETEKTVHLTKTGTTYEFRMVVRDGVSEEDEFLELAVIFARELSANVFGGSPVDVHFCDDQLRTLRLIPSL